MSTFAEEYRKLYDDTVKRIKDHNGSYYDQYLIKQEYEVLKQHLIDKYKGSVYDDRSGKDVQSSD